MNIVFFTPVNVTSAIGKTTFILERHLLSMGHTLTFVQTELKNYFHAPTHPFVSPILKWNAETQIQQALNQCDIAIYQFGNFYDFHAGSVYWLFKFPGLVILHDYSLAGLFFSWAQTHQQEAQSILYTWYGKNAVKKFYGYAASPKFYEYTFQTMPLIEWVCSEALGVITHSDWGISHVLSSCAGIIRSIPLPYETLAKHCSPLNTEKKKKLSRFKILTFGYMNTNKRVEQVIKAIHASSTLKKNVIYQLAGLIDNATKNKLQYLGERFNIHIEIYGKLDDMNLQNLIDQADIIVCLRYPPVESASASLIESLLSGKVTVVTDIGFYSELPDDCVFKIKHYDEINSIKDSLEFLIKNENKRKEIALKGKIYAENTFSSKKYAKELCRTIHEVNNIKLIANFTQRTSQLLKSWNLLLPKEINKDILNTLEFMKASRKSRKTRTP